LLAEIEAICLIFQNRLTLLVLLSQLQLQLLYQYRVSNPLDSPPATFFKPFTMACAKTVAVVVPSPAKSLVLEATLTI
jgi:hypothetical protein